MITKEYREVCKLKGFSFIADKGFIPNKRFDITITEKETGSKAKLRILHAFSEMDVMCWTDISKFSTGFKEIVRDTINHIALIRNVKSITLFTHGIYPVNDWGT